MKTNNQEKTNAPYDLSCLNIWSQHWFEEVLFLGMKFDGLSPESCEWLREIFKKNQPVSLDQFQDFFEKSKNLASQSVQKELSAYFPSFYNDAKYNLNCYIRDTPEKTRVTQYPNNQNTKVRNPSHYFDIYQDLFFRNHHRFITKDTPIGSAGSCFATRIAHQLQSWGYNYIIKEDDLPEEFPIENLYNSNFRQSPARVGTLFNVPSMRQMVERGFGLWEPEHIVVKEGDKIYDPFRSVKPLYSNYEEFVVDYNKHTIALRSALLSCDVFILTLGLTEAWYFAHSGAYTSVAPHKIEPTLLRRRSLDVNENVNELESLFATYRKNKPNIKLIISVSPVPLNKTYSQTDHIVSASNLSKSILRVATDIFVKNHPEDVFYFPSYEMVMFGSENPWEIDMRHVSSESVQRVMHLFSEMFLADPKPEGFLNFEPMQLLRKTPLMMLKNVLRPLRGILKVG